MPKALILARIGFVNESSQKMKTEYSQGLGGECLTKVCPPDHHVPTAGALCQRVPERTLRVAQAKTLSKASEAVIRRFDPLGAHVHLALRSVVRGVHKHVYDHGAAVWITTTFPRRNVPGAL